MDTENSEVKAWGRSMGGGRSGPRGVRRGTSAIFSTKKINF